MNEDGQISKEIALKLSDHSLVLKELEAGQPGYLLFGYSNQMMEKFYEKAHHFLKKNQVQEAIDSFVFLTTLDPSHSEYWMGFGASLQLAHDYEGAIDAYEMAAIHNIEHPLPYLFLGKCLFAIHDRESALQAFELAISCAEESFEYDEIKLEALSAKEHLLKMD